MKRVRCLLHGKWLVIGCNCEAYCGHLHYHCPYGFHAVMAGGDHA